MLAAIPNSSFTDIGTGIVKCGCHATERHSQEPDPKKVELGLDEGASLVKAC